MAGELILIIEDNEKNRKLVRDVLQVKGHKTIESETAEEGLKLAIEKSPRLILMDIQLPGQRASVKRDGRRCWGVRGEASISGHSRTQGY
jgi:CheY-like chemotaxis protein